MTFFVMICGGKGNPIPLCPDVEHIEVAALFDSEDEAEEAASKNNLAMARGYTVYPWEWTE